tara:strand:+ start:8641 stop:8979 length:339 start_codon:yes stop_codon:yes gene_type:complete
MKEIGKVLAIFILVVGILLGSAYGLGWIKVNYTETVGKAQKNAERTVYQESNSFTKGKTQEAIKYYKEWQEADSPEEKQAIENIISMSFADFNEDKHITDPKLLSWIKNAKY